MSSSLVSENNMSLGVGTTPTQPAPHYHLKQTAQGSLRAGQQGETAPKLSLLKAGPKAQASTQEESKVA